MKEHFFTLMPAALLLLAMNPARAADNATITITGQVNATSCAVNLSRTTLPLGSFPQSAFAAALAPVAASAQTFDIQLSECTAAEGTELLVQVNGTALAGQPTLFADSGATGNVGVMLTTIPGSPIEIGKNIVVGTLEEGTPTTVTVTAQLASSATGASVTTGPVSAPIMFSYIAP